MKVRFDQAETNQGINGNQIWTVVDLFSGIGGMSYGFSKRKPFQIVAAVDAQQGKPCESRGRLDCNSGYAANIGISPFDYDIAELDPQSLVDQINQQPNHWISPNNPLTVLLCCPPCTDFSRAKPNNHLVDSPKNSLVVKCADFVETMTPEFVVMENARELIQGHHAHHFREFRNRLIKMGYDVQGEIHKLTRFGLPQIRERALVIASRIGPVKTLDDLWKGWKHQESAITVRHAIEHFNTLEAGQIDLNDPMHQAPSFANDSVRRRIEAVPQNGGSWFDLANRTDAEELLIPSMKDRLKRNDLGSHPDVYGRMAWDKPAPTIKRECAHVGNGRYAHPEQTRLLSVREMSLLQGFPSDFIFPANSLANKYRHIGDAVPPIISYQLSALVTWMKTGRRPPPQDWILPKSTLRWRDLQPSKKLVAQSLF